MPHHQAIEITGITPASEFPACPPETWGETGIAGTLIIPCPEPDIRRILSAYAAAIVTGHKILCTPAGQRLVVHAAVTFTVHFQSATGLATRHTASLCLPACLAIPLEGSCHVKKVHLLIEDVSVWRLCLRSIAVTALIAAYPEFGSCQRDGEGCIRCDIKIRSGSGERA